MTQPIPSATPISPSAQSIAAAPAASSALAPKATDSDGDADGSAPAVSQTPPAGVGGFVDRKA